MIDVDKFLNSVLNYPGNGTLTNTVKMLFTYALSEQNLEFKDGEIQSIENKPKWYKCIKEYRSFTVGKLYCTNENGDLSSDQDVDFRYVIAIDNPYFKEWFRPATEEELLRGGLDDSFWSKEEIDELIQETDEGSKKMMEAMRKIVFAKETDIYAMALKYQQSHRCSNAERRSYCQGLIDMCKLLKEEE